MFLSSIYNNVINFCIVISVPWGSFLGFPCFEGAFVYVGVFLYQGGGRGVDEVPGHLLWRSGGFIEIKAAPMVMLLARRSGSRLPPGGPQSLIGLPGIQESWQSFEDAFVDVGVF